MRMYGIALQAEDGIAALGVSVIMGGPPEYENRILVGVFPQAHVSHLRVWPGR